MSIVELEARIAALPPEARAAAERIYAVSTTTGTLVAPDEMRPWIEKLFGSVESVAAHRIVRVTDRVMLEGALFNDLRARRPMAVPEKSGAEVAETIRTTENDPFCHPETGTPADDFGRISGRLGVTASNVAKYDGYHGVLVFNAHDPLAPMEDSAIADYFATARKWAEAAVARDPAAPYYFLMWNCLWRAGGSIVHGHMQMTTTHGMHYPKVERLRQAALAYAERHRRDYGRGPVAPGQASPPVRHSNRRPPVPGGWARRAPRLRAAVAARFRGPRGGVDRRGAPFRRGRRARPRALPAAARRGWRGLAPLPADRPLGRSWRPRQPHVRYRVNGALRRERHRFRSIRRGHGVTGSRRTLNGHC